MLTRNRFLPLVEALDDRCLPSATSQSLLGASVLPSNAKPDGLPIITMQRDLGLTAGLHRGAIQSETEQVIHRDVRVGQPFNITFTQAIPKHVTVHSVKITWMDGTSDTVVRNDSGTGNVTLKLIGTSGNYNIYQLKAVHVYRAPGDYATTFSLNGNGVPTNVFTFHARLQGAQGPANNNPERRHDETAALGRYFAQMHQQQHALPSSTAGTNDGNTLGHKADVSRN